MSMYSANDLEETPTPALVGFDLFHLVTFRLWPHGLDLAVLPRWFLALEITFALKGRVVCGKVLGRCIYGKLEAKGGARRWGMTREQDGTRYLRLGRFWVVIDTRQASHNAVTAE